MEDNARLNPVTILREIEYACRACAANVPQQLQESASQWSGIAFRIGRHSLLAALEEIGEILDMPPITRVPLAQSWIRGIANVRGNLLPVTDLKGFLGFEMTRITDKTRILVIQRGGVYAGFMVDEVYGLKHFEDGEEVGIHTDMEKKLQPYIRRAYLREGELWCVFGVSAVADAPQFLMAAG